MKTPGQRIKEERQNKGWSQQRLADEISRIKHESISRAAIALWEGGNSKTQKPENLFAAAKALGLTPHWVLYGSGEKHLSHTQNQQGSIPSREDDSDTVVTIGRRSSDTHPAISEVINLMNAMDEAGKWILVGTAREIAKRHLTAENKQAVLSQ